MLDFKEIDKAYEENRFYSLQLEIGDKCYQGCVYCYMNALPVQKNVLTDEEIFDVLDDSARLKISAIEWLGGEPLIRKSVFDFMKKSRDLGFRNNMWTGGLPFTNKNTVKTTAELCQRGLISVHVSSINPAVYKKLHPERPKKDLNLIINGVKDLLNTGYPASQILNSVTYTGLQSADDMIETMDYFYKEFGIATSLNVYHTYLRPENDQTDLQTYIPTEEEVQKVYDKYISFMDGDELPLNCVNKQYCSSTLAVLNNGVVSPCATIRKGPDETVKTGSFYNIVNSNRDFLTFKYFKNKSNLPEKCKKCKINDVCWGCRSRAFAAGKGIYGDDPRCFR